jgi:hypothetical protein
LIPPFPYTLPAAAHARRHGPWGYIVYETYKDWLRDDFQFRCAFCMHREVWDRRGWRVFQVDHIIPQSIDPSKIHLYDNLLYCCDSCNGFKSNRVLPDPCVMAYSQHIRFERNGKVTPLTPFGELYIEVLGLDEDHLERFRRKVAKNYDDLEALVAELGDDDEDVRQEIEALLGYPPLDDIPDLRVKRESGNTRPGGKARCYHVLLQDPNFPRVY